MAVAFRDQAKMRNNVAEVLQNGDQAGLLALLTLGGEVEFADTTTVDRLSLACLMEAAFSMAREPQPILMSKGAQAVHSERETELEREMEWQAIKLSQVQADYAKIKAERESAECRLKLVRKISEEAIRGAWDTMLEMVAAAAEDEDGIPF